jgi:hypothetical protein
MSSSNNNQYTVVWKPFISSLEVQTRVCRADVPYLTNHRVYWGLWNSGPHITYVGEEDAALVVVFTKLAERVLFK